MVKNCSSQETAHVFCYTKSASRTCRVLISSHSVQVPVLEFNRKKLGDSLHISKFLDEEFPEPSVFKTSCDTGMLHLLFCKKNLHIA